MRTSTLFVSFIFSLAVMAVSCSPHVGSDITTSLSDAKGLSVSDEVHWRGVRVGEVSNIELRDGKVLVSISLMPQFQNQLPADARAKATKGFLGQGRPRLDLFGGANPGAGLLSPGASIPEAGTMDGISREHVVWTAVAVGIALLLLFIIRGFSFLIRLAITVVLIAATAWFATLQWNRYKHHVITPDIEAQIAEKAYAVLSTPEAQAIWKGITADAASTLDAGKAVGRDATATMYSHLKTSLEQNITNLTARGEAGIASDLAKLKEFIEHSKE